MAGSLLGEDLVLGYAVPAGIAFEAWNRAAGTAAFFQFARRIPVPMLIGLLWPLSRVIASVRGPHGPSRRPGLPGCPPRL